MMMGIRGEMKWKIEMNMIKLLFFIYYNYKLNYNKYITKIQYKNKL
jgi:hypothetical protein